MALDKGGTELKVGDRVTLECVVTHVSPGTDGMNVGLQTVEAVPPGDGRVNVAVNSKQVESVQGPRKKDKAA